MKRFARNQMGKIDAFVPRKRFMWDKAATYKEIPGISAGPSNAPQQAVRKVLARLKYSVPLYKARSGFWILTEECLTFRTVSPSRGVPESTQSLGATQWESLVTLS